MLHARRLLLVLATVLVAPSLAATAAPCGSATEALCAPPSRAVHDSGVIVQAQYITREQQKERAEKNLKEKRQQRDNSNYSVYKSTRTETSDDYGKRYLEEPMRGAKQPRVHRPH